MQWTNEQNIHIQTVLHLNKGDDNARGHIGTELNNKAETVLQVTKDNTLPERSIVAPAIIRSKPFDKFAFQLKEMEDGMCVPEIDHSYSDNECKSHRYSYHELSDTEHRNALKQTFVTSEVLSYGEIIAALKKAYAEVVGQAYGQTKLKELLLFLLNKGLLVKEERGNIGSTKIISPKTFGRSDAGYIYQNQPDQRETSLVGRKRVPIVYDQLTKQKSTSLQKKKVDHHSFQTSKQNHNGYTTYQANPNYRLFATAVLYPYASTRHSLLVLLSATQRRYAIIQSKYRAQPMV